MDINSLLSPSETPQSTSSTPASPAPSPLKFVQRTHSGTLHSKHAPAGASPLSQQVMTHTNPNIPAHVLSPAQQPLSSPLISPVPTTSNSHLIRSTSTPALETLADISNHQSLKSAPANVRNRDAFDPSKSPSFLNPTLAATLTSNPRASFDINMMDTPKQVVRTDYSGTSLSDDQQKKLGLITARIQETPSDYESHCEVIKILHQGFIDHIYPPTESNTRRDPHTYELLTELRNARESMEKLFAVGERLWADWLQDESILARTAEERIAVVEQCRRAVNEEAGSVQLWTTYGEWVQHCYDWAHDTTYEVQNNGVPDEERLVGREIFTRQLVLDTWQEATDQTCFDLAQSHLVWNKYLAVRIPNIEQKLAPDQVSACGALFEQRLQTPHAAWDETFQAFSSFVSTNYEPTQYEHFMSDMLQQSAEAKKKWSARESFESAIVEANRLGDRDGEYHAFAQYLAWEQTPEKRRKMDPAITNALFQRAELKYPSDVTVWEEHVSFLLARPKPILLPLLERATKHCPWSGSLWSQYLLASDRAGQAFHNTEAIKHKATSTGLLEAAGIDEVVKVHAAWCSYLRRRSFRPEGSEEDLDVAEMGIRSSIENVASLAAKVGSTDLSDPAFRLHRIYINFLSESGRWDNARQEFDNSIRDYGTSWEFWMLFYHWEMGRWRRFASNQQNSSEEPLANIAPPHLATAVLKKALDQPSLDYPEPIMQALITHCEDYEDADEIQTVMLKVQKSQRAVTARRQVEAAMAAESAPARLALETEESNLSQRSKRKREDEEPDEESNKKVKNEDIAQQSLERTDSSAPKRDRENATILVENLPENITETHVRQYFSNCGNVRSLKLLHDEGFSAIIEFDDDEAARYALSRDGQELNGAILSIHLDVGSTLYITNYKPSADEAYIRNLFDKFGDILSVRFPSLQANKKRRFCYLQFKLPNEAQTASAEMDGQQLDEYTLSCKVSNPAQRQVRKEYNINDGHTIFIGQLNFKATETELDKSFSEYGKIEKIRMPLHPVMKTRNKGIAYITYETIHDARKAVEKMNGQALTGRKITVEIATGKPGDDRKRASSARSATPDPIARRDRQLFLANVPDTVNEARLREICQAHGKINRIILKTNHQGAIIEYSDPTEAGQAALKLDGFSIVPGRSLSVVSESELLSHSREKKADGFGPGREKPKPKPAAPIGAPVPLKRPIQPGTRRGGNLGQRTAIPNQGEQSKQTNGEDTKLKKNDDFRALLNASK